MEHLAAKEPDVIGRDQKQRLKRLAGHFNLFQNTNRLKCDDKALLCFQLVSAASSGQDQKIAG